MNHYISSEDGLKFSNLYGTLAKMIRRVFAIVRLLIRWHTGILTKDMAAQTRTATEKQSSETINFQ